MTRESITALCEEYAKSEKHQFVPHDAQRVRYLLREVRAHREALRWFCRNFGDIQDFCQKDCSLCPFRDVCTDDKEMMKVLLDIGHALLKEKPDDN